MNEVIIDRLERVVNQDIQRLRKIVIFTDIDGSYNLYDKYLINKTKDGLYEVSVIGTYTTKNFYKLKNALAWCSYDLRNLFNGANRLHQLDQIIYSMDTEIQIHIQLIKKTTDLNNKFIYLSKLTQNKAKKRKYTMELDRYVNEFKNWQNRQFETKPKY